MKQNTVSKKIALILVLPIFVVVFCLCFFLLNGSINVSAAATLTVGGGKGTEWDPYIISTVDHLKSLRDYVNAGNHMDNTYISIISDLDLSGETNFTPIGDSRYGNNVYFAGIIRGNHHNIKNLTINIIDAPGNGSHYGAAFIGVAKSAYIFDLCLQNVNVSCGNLYSYDSYTAAGLIAYDYGSVITECNIISGNIKAQGSNPAYAGGVIGVGNNANIINYCFNNASISCQTRLGHSTYAGGIVAYLSLGSSSYGILQQCGNNASVNCTGRDDSGLYAGGIVGYCDGVSPSYCYNRGDVTSLENYGRAGGIAGYSNREVRYSYNIGDVSISATSISNSTEAFYNYSYTTTSGALWWKTTTTHNVSVTVGVAVGYSMQFDVNCNLLAQSDTSRCFGINSNTVLPYVNVYVSYTTEYGTYSAGSVYVKFDGTNNDFEIDGERGYYVGVSSNNNTSTSGDHTVTISMKKSGAVLKQTSESVTVYSQGITQVEKGDMKKLQTNMPESRWGVNADINDGYCFPRGIYWAHEAKKPE